MTVTATKTIDMTTSGIIERFDREWEATLDRGNSLRKLLGDACVTDLVRALCRQFYFEGRVSVREENLRGEA